LGVFFGGGGHVWVYIVQGTAEVSCHQELACIRCTKGFAAVYWIQAGGGGSICKEYAKGLAPYPLQVCLPISSLGKCHHELTGTDAVLYLTWFLVHERWMAACAKEPSIQPPLAALCCAAVCSACRLCFRAGPAPLQGSATPMRLNPWSCSQAQRLCGWVPTTLAVWRQCWQIQAPRSLDAGPTRGPTTSECR
jgi:hypothetical protein